MRQIKDMHGNVLSEPYLTMATANFNSEFNNDFEQTHSLADAFDFRDTPEGSDFWVAVWNDKPVPIANNAQPTVQAATAARMALEKRFTNEVKDFENRYDVTVRLINVNRDINNETEITVSATV